MKKLATFLLAAALVAAFFAADLHQLLTLAGLKSALTQLLAARETAPVQLALQYFGLYVLVATVSLPGAAILTLAGGALFGVVWGTVLVSFASSIGAALAFLLSRYVLRDAVQRQLGHRLGAVNAGMARDGAWYLLTLRLIPVVPFFLVNLLMGVSTLPVRTYYWFSQLGMLPATVVYVNAGTQLAAIRSLSDVGSPAVLASLALLGLLPLLMRPLVQVLQRRRVYARWQRPRRFDRNLIVIGAGAAGLVTAYIAAAVNAKVTLVEAHRMGGDCLNYGCVPSKALIKSARLAQQMRHAQTYGLSATEPRLSFREVMARVHAVIANVAPHDSVARYTALGVDVVAGHARIVDPWTVEIARDDGATQRLTTRAIVIATGARPLVPPLPGLDEVGYLTSDTLWDALAQRDAPPQRLVVLGGGPMGCELAQAIAQLGSQVTHIERAARLMQREDTEVSELVRAALVQDGVDVRTSCQVLRCELEREGDVERKFIVVDHQGQQERIEFDDLICAVGRVARLQGYGLEELGLETKCTVSVNDYLETLYPNIYAAGDVAGLYPFTHTAGHMAWYAAVNALFGTFKKFRVDYSVVPWATFVSPEVARVGLNEQEARAKGVAYEVTRFDLADLDRAIADSTTQGFVKVLTVPGKDHILGVTIVGEHAGDLIAEYVLAMKHGLGLNQILGTLHIYPTLAEANKYAAGAWKRAHAPQRLLRWVERFHAWQRREFQRQGGRSA